jgi:hypothetical protein
VIGYPEKPRKAPQDPNRPVEELPPFQPDPVLVETYGTPLNVFEIRIYAPNGSIRRTIEFQPRTWFSLRQMQRHLFRDYGSDFQPYSVGYTD